MLISYYQIIFCGCSNTNHFIIVIRDALYTTQPLELLNALGFENLKNNRALIGDLEVNSGDSPSIKSDYEGVDSRRFDVSDNGRNPNASVLMDNKQDSGVQMNLDGSEGQVFKVL